jgi:protein-S-isoprenylcysteine O-methyltransferase Ste14
MTLTAPPPSQTNSGLIVRTFSLVYGTVVYTIFLGTFVYAIGFSSRFIVPKHVNSGGAVSPPYAIVTDLILMSIFAIQHSGMARKGFKRLKQVGMNFIGRPAPATSFATPGFYRHVRHPLYLGFIIAFWATPTMTVGNLLFAAMATAYIFIGIALEERDLVAAFGEQYRQYKARVAMLLPSVF